MITWTSGQHDALKGRCFASAWYRGVAHRWLSQGAAYAAATPAGPTFSLLLPLL